MREAWHARKPRSKDVLLFLVGTFFFGVLSIYFFESNHPVFQFLLAALLIWMAIEDARDTTIDLRILFGVLIIGLFESGEASTRVLLFLLCFLILQFFALITVSITDAPPKEHEEVTEDGEKNVVYATKPNETLAFVPLYLGGLILLLAFYLLYLIETIIPDGFVIAYESIQNLLHGFGQIPVSQLSIGVFFFLFLIDLLLYGRIYRAKHFKQTVRYRLCGAGDLYFLPVMAAVFGLPMATGALLFAIYLALFILSYRKVRERH